MDNGHCLVTYDFECPKCQKVHERTVKRREVDEQVCPKCYERMVKLFPTSKKWGEQYPFTAYTIEGEPVITSPAHYKRVLREHGLTCVGKTKGHSWS